MISVKNILAEGVLIGSQIDRVRGFIQVFDVNRPVACGGKLAVQDLPSVEICNTEQDRLFHRDLGREQPEPEAITFFNEVVVADARIIFPQPVIIGIL